MNPPPTHPEHVDERTVRSVSRQSHKMFVLIVIIAAIPAFAEGFDTSLYAFGSPFIIKSLHGVNLDLLGLMATGYALGIAIFSFVGGYLFDRFSVKYTIIVAVAIFAASTLLTGFAQNLTELFIFRLFVGIGVGLFQPAIIALLGDIFFETRGRGVSMFAVFFGGGVFLSPYIISPFLPHYTTPFIISAAFSLLALILFYLIIPPTYKRVERRKIGLQGIFKRNVMILSLSIFLFGITLFGFRSYFSDYLLNGLVLTKGRAASIASMEGLGGLICAFPMGYLADRYGRKPLVTVTAILIMIGSIGIFSGVHLISPLFLATFIFGAGWGVYVDLVAALGQDSVADQVAGTVTGWLLLVFNLGALAGGPLFGSLLSHGFVVAGLVGVGLPAALSFFVTLGTQSIRQDNVMAD